MGTPPLDAGEELLWRSLMRLVITVPRAMGNTLERAAGLTITEYTVLMHLSESPEQQLRMSDLADRTALSPSRMTRVIDQLAGRGLVAKYRCPEDGRSVRAGVTRAGLRALQGAYPAHLASVRQAVFDHLNSEETEAVGTVLGRLAESVDAAGSRP